MELILGIIGITLPLLLVFVIALHERVAAVWVAFVVFSLFAVVFVMKFMANLTDMQLGFFALLFGLSVIGIASLFKSHGRVLASHEPRTSSIDETAQLLVDSLNKERRQ